MNEQMTLEETREAFSRVSHEAGERVMTVWEQAIAEGEARGEARGRAEGEARGEARGRAEGKAASLLKMIQLRFGAPSQQITQRVQAASEQQLDAWLERLLTVESVEQLLSAE